MNLIYDNLDKIIALCKKYKVKNMYVFGSILTPRFNDESDIDLSVNMLPESDPLISGDNFINLYLDLNELLSRRVDLVSEECVRNPYFKTELNQTKQIIYES